MLEEDHQEAGEVDQVIVVVDQAIAVAADQPIRTREVPIDHTGPIPQCINTQTPQVLLSSLMVIWGMVNTTITQLTEKELAIQTTAMIQTVVPASFSFVVAASFAASFVYLLQVVANLMNNTVQFMKSLLRRQSLKNTTAITAEVTEEDTLHQVDMVNHLLIHQVNTHHRVDMVNLA